MKNKTIILIQIAVLVLVFIMLSGIAAAFIFRGDFVRGFKMPFFGGDEGSLTMTQSQTFSDIKEINVDAISYSVYIEEHNSSDVIVEEYIKSTANVKNEISSQGGELYFKQPKKFAFFNMDFGKIVIKVPQGSELKYDIDSVSGKINLDAQSKTADLETTSGSVNLYQSGDTADVNSVSGSIKGYAPFRKIDAESISGSIKLTADYKTSEVKADTISGSVKIELLDTGVGYIMEYSTVSGSVKDEYNNTKYEKRGTVKQGDEQIDIETTTVSGSINLENWQ